MIESLKRSTIIRDYLIFAISILLIMMAIFSWFISNFYKAQINKTANNSEAQALRIERTFVADIEYISNQMELISAQISRKGTDEKFLFDLLKSFQSTPSNNNVISWNMFSWVNDKKLLTVDGKEGILKKPVDLSTRDYLPKTTKQPGRIFLGNPVFGAVSENWIIPAGMGVTDQNGKYIGSIVFGFDITHYISKLEHIIKPEGMSFAILDQGNNVVVESADNRFILINNNIVDKLGNINHSERFTVIESDNVFWSIPNYALALKLAVYPFTILVSYDNDIMNKEILSNLYIYLLEFVTILLTLVFMFIFLHRRIVKPIVYLSKAADAISRGKKSVAIPYIRSYEIQNLAHQLENVLDYVNKIKRIDKKLIKAKQDAERANKAKSDFLANMSHELRTPLNAIIGYSEIIAKQAFGRVENAKYLEYAGDIHKSGTHLLSLINDILDISKAESGKFEIEEVVFDLSNTMNECIDIVRNYAERYKVVIVLRPMKDLPKIYADDLRMRQVIINILSNAIKFSKPSGGKIDISVKANRKGLFILIKDNGIGIKKEDLPIVLEKFGQIDTPLKRKTEGSGLGLWLSKTLVESHKGNLVLESEYGKGTIVTIKLPASCLVNTQIKTTA